MTDPAADAERASPRRRSGRTRLLVLASHPIQYRSPLYRYLARQEWLDLEVWYGDQYGVSETRQGWGQAAFRWDVDMLGGYRYRWLRNVSPRPDPSSMFGKVNPELWAGVRRAGPDAVWIAGYSTAHQWLALSASWRARVPVLYSSDTNALSEPSGLKRVLKHAVIERLYRRLAGFLVAGSLNDRHYEDYGVPRSKRFPFPWAVDNEFFAGRAAESRGRRGEIRASWGVAEPRTVLLLPARLIELKRPLDLIHAAAAIERAHVVFAGTGDLEETCRAEAARWIPGRHTFLGFVPQQALPEVYAASDLMVLPSSWEAWGLVVNEAMACGVSVVASERVGAAVDLVRPEMRHAPRDVEGLRRALEAGIAWIADAEAARAFCAERMTRFSFQADAAGLRVALAAVLGREGSTGVAPSERGTA